MSVHSNRGLSILKHSTAQVQPAGQLCELKDVRGDGVNQARSSDSLWLWWKGQLLGTYTVCASSHLRSLDCVNVVPQSREKVGPAGTSCCQGITWPGAPRRHCHVVGSGSHVDLSGTHDHSGVTAAKDRQRKSEDPACLHRDRQRGQGATHSHWFRWYLSWFQFSVAAKLTDPRTS